MFSSNERVVKMMSINVYQTKYICAVAQAEKSTVKASRYS